MVNAEEQLVFLIVVKMYSNEFDSLKFLLFPSLSLTHTPARVRNQNDSDAYTYKPETRKEWN